LKNLTYIPLLVNIRDVSFPHCCRGDMADSLLESMPLGVAHRSIAPCLGPEEHYPRIRDITRQIASDGAVRNGAPTRRLFSDTSMAHTFRSANVQACAQHLGRRQKEGTISWNTDPDGRFLFHLSLGACTEQCSDTALRGGLFVLD